MTIEVDDRWLRQVYFMAISLMVIGSAIVWFSIGVSESASFVIGSILSISFLWTLDIAIRRLITPSAEPKTKRIFGSLLIIKYFVIFGLFYVLLKLDWLNVYLFAIGITLIQLVMIVKAVILMIGIVFENRKI